MKSEVSKLDRMVPWLVRVLSAVLCLVLIAVIWVPPQWAIKNRPWYDFIYPAGLWASMLLFAIWPDILRRPRSDRRFLAIILILFVLSRLAWVLLVPTQPFSDFAEYNNWASIFGRFQPIHGDMFRLSINLALQPWLYPISLGVLYDLFGHHLILPELANIVAGAMTLLLVYLLARQLFDTDVARLSAILFLFWPAQLMYTSVLASEHLAVVLTLSAIVFLMRALRGEQGNYRTVIITGLFLGLSFATRYAVIVALPSFILTLALTRRPLKWKAGHAIWLVMAFLITFGLYLGVVAAIWRQVPLPRGGLHLLMGTNAASGGTHIHDDSVLYESHATMAEADQFARAEALRRIRSNPSGFIRLMGDKVVTFWKDDFYGEQYSTQEMSPGAAKSFLDTNERTSLAISHFFHLSILVLGVVAGLFLVLRGGDARVIMILSVILGGTLLHSITVVQARYHYQLEPLLIILAAFGMLSLSSVAVSGLARFGKLVSRGQGNTSAAFDPRLESNSDSQTPKTHSSVSSRFSRRNMTLLALAGIVLMLISIMALKGSLWMDHRSEVGSAPVFQTAPQPASGTKANLTANPNPVKVCDGSGLGITTVSYAFPPGRLVEVHVGSPDGQLFARPAVPGSSATAKWLADGMTFFLQDVTDGKPPSQDNTLATVTVRVTTEGCQ